ncbi:hypothetical protein E1295_14200 [Nonomuraea mesophila]|uniref:Uncharacterized protein n=1 Tax=Nonomuraea mesophila TaxID=2530382 RepID=A0A4R5FNV9_9ACTN|nr:hypothetical protein [Nonomuraea mesophila]TDE54676.1 hypothetical protein E1295_14200 [Nonomuraea mesophila]
MNRPFEGIPLRAGVIAVALAGGLLAAPTAEAAAASGGQAVVSVSQAAAANTAANTAAHTAARPRNGKIIYDRYSGGSGRLRIRNGTSKDGVVTLVKGRKKAVSIYVRARSSASVNDVRSGTYRVYFTTGHRFHAKKRKFTRNASYQRFDQRLRFTSTSGWRLTLNPVRGGNARTRSVNPKDFPA